MDRESSCACQSAQRSSGGDRGDATSRVALLKLVTPARRNVAAPSGGGVAADQVAMSAANFSFRWVMRSFASLLRTAIAYAAGSPTMNTFFFPRVIAV